MVFPFITYTNEFKIDETYAQALLAEAQQKISDKNSAVKVALIEKDGSVFLQYTHDFTTLFLLSVAAQIGVTALQYGSGLLVLSTLGVWGWLFGGNRYLRSSKNNFKIGRLIVKYEQEKNETTVSDEQQEWIRDENKCPACGNKISKASVTCSDCGLSLG